MTDSNNSRTEANMSDSSNTADGLEPRFSLPLDTPRSSKLPLVIGGVQIYLYGLDDLQESTVDDIAVLYLAHNRTRTYRVTEGIAHEILHRYRQDGRRKKMHMIAVTMNMRNHGDREVDHRANQTWSKGNENHGIDLMAMISGSAQDFKLILDYLPAYLPQFRRFHNIMLGVSMGGHTAWRLASLASGQLEAFAIVVGCPNLSSLLLSRLGVEPAVFGVQEDELDTVPYDELEKAMNEEQRRRWPRALAELVREGDAKAKEEFPRGLPLLMCNGKYDELVPARFSESWLERRKRDMNGAYATKSNTRLFVQDNTGHSCTKEMVAMIADWIGALYQA